jgi:hypothetical protein
VVGETWETIAWRRDDQPLIPYLWLFFPLFAPLRSHPRFIALLERMHVA